MTRREGVLAALGLALLAAGWQLVRMSQTPARDFVLTEVCRTPIRVLEPTGPRRIGSAVVFHGLSASRRIMQTLGQDLAALGLRVYLVDSAGHGDSTEPFTFERAENCAGDLVEALARRGEIDPQRTVLAGHSMGGAIAIRLADRLPTAATIAISPAPMVRAPGIPADLVFFSLPRRMPVNLLVLHGGLEPSSKAAADEALLRAAGGERLQPEDFAERRAAKYVSFPAASHTSLLFDRRVRGWIVDWARSALREPAGTPASHGAPVTGCLLGLAGLVMMFPLAASGLTAALRIERKEAAPQGSETEEVKAPMWRTLISWGLAGIFGVSALRFWVPLNFLKLMTGSYLASFLLLAGVVLIFFLRGKAKAVLRLESLALAMGCLLGLATMLAFGAWLDWQFTDAWMNTQRWLRFFPIVVVALPYCLAEELALGSPGSGRGWKRFALFVVLRLELGLALVVGIYVLRSGQVLIVLLAFYLAVVSLLQRWGADAVRRRTGSVTAAAAFGAILTAWFIAAVFPLV